MRRLRAGEDLRFQGCPVSGLLQNLRRGHYELATETPTPAANRCRVHRARNRELNFRPRGSPCPTQGLRNSLHDRTLDPIVPPGTARPHADLEPGASAAALREYERHYNERVQATSGNLQCQTPAPAARTGPSDHDDGPYRPPTRPPRRSYPRVSTCRATCMDDIFGTRTFGRAGLVTFARIRRPFPCHATTADTAAIIDLTPTRRPPEPLISLSPTPGNVSGSSGCGSAPGSPAMLRQAS